MEASDEEISVFCNTVNVLFLFFFGFFLEVAHCCMWNCFYNNFVPFFSPETQWYVRCVTRTPDIRGADFRSRRAAVMHVLSLCSNTPDSHEWVIIKPLCRKPADRCLILNGAAFKTCRSVSLEAPLVCSHMINPSVTGQRAPGSPRALLYPQ